MNNRDCWNVYHFSCYMLVWEWIGKFCLQLECDKCREGSKSIFSGIYLIKDSNKHLFFIADLEQVLERTQQVITCSKITIETLEQRMKYVQS